MKIQAENLEAFAKQVTAHRLREFSPAIAAEHMFDAWQHEPSLYAYAVRCRCGWYWSISCIDVNRLLAEMLAAVLDRHVDEVIALHSPTLADMADWGWFHAEAA